MDYIWEAVWLILAVIVPLGVVVWFLQRLIRSLGDSTSVTPVPEETNEE